MFCCEAEKCGKLTKPRQPVNYVVTEYRSMTYENKVQHGRDRGKMKSTYGQEIVHEKKLCPECYVLYTGEQPKKLIVPLPIKFTPRPKREQPKNRKWQNPRFTKSKQTKSSQLEKKKPTVQVINPLTSTPIIKG